jgi:hypothetical protein
MINFKNFSKKFYRSYFITNSFIFKNNNGFEFLQSRFLGALKVRVSNKLNLFLYIFFNLFSWKREVHKSLIFADDILEPLYENLDESQYTVIAGNFYSLKRFFLCKPFIPKILFEIPLYNLILDNRENLNPFLSSFDNPLNQKYIFFEDITPVPLFLSYITTKYKNKNTFVLQHGLHYSRFSKKMAIEGYLSKNVFLFDIKTLRRVKRHFTSIGLKKKYFLGPPISLYKGRFATPQKSSTYKILLVGPGEPLASDYMKMICVFKYVHDALIDMGFEVLYRPHSSEKNLVFLQKFFPKFELTNKKNLFMENYIFVGFNSTLLYEAELSGFWQFRLIDFDLYFDEFKVHVGNINSIINEISGIIKEKKFLKSKINHNDLFLFRKEFQKIILESNQC